MRNWNKKQQSPDSAQKELRTQVFAAGSLSSQGALGGRMRNWNKSGTGIKAELE